MVGEGFFNQIGSTIECVRWMTDEEMEKEGWESGLGRPGVVLEMVGGGKIYASADKEGNGPGVFFGETSEGESVYIGPSQAPNKVG